MLRPKLNRVWAGNSSTLRRDPGDTKYIQGWISEIPTYQVLNYLQYKIDTTLLALAERGVFEWGRDVQYGLNTLAWDETNKTVYVSIVGSPDRNKAPSTNPDHWVASSVQVTRASYDAVVSAINTHIADITGNPHKLTAGRLNAYNKNEIDNIVAQYQAIVAAHTIDKKNPHNVTALQIGAVPATGGTYSGDVIFSAGIFFDTGKTTAIIKSGGIFLKNGAGQIGIDNTGVGKVGPTGSLSSIVTEASYPDVKALQEPNYTTAIPVFAMNLIGDINIRVGTGTTDDPSPAYNVNAGNCYLYSPNVAKTLKSSDNVNATGKVTISVDLMSPDPRSATSTAENVHFGTEQINLVGLDNGTYGVKIAGTKYAMTQLTGPVGTWYKFAITYDGAVAIIYINGVEVGRQAIVATPTGTNKVILDFVAKISPVLRRWNIRNLQIWDYALSAKQVSTL